MQICVVGVWDTEHAADIESHFPDVIAYLESIEPPVYPHDLDEQRVAEGKIVFEQNCASCHGTYDPNPDMETYPNKLISLKKLVQIPIWLKDIQNIQGF